MYQNQEPQEKNIIMIDKPECLKCSRLSTVLDKVPFVKKKNPKTGETKTIKISVKEYSCGPETNPACPASSFKIILGTNVEHVAQQIVIAERCSDTSKLSALYLSLENFDPIVKEAVMAEVINARQYLAEALWGKQEQENAENNEPGSVSTEELDEESQEQQ